MLKPTLSADFDAIRLRLASPEAIKSWSHGEVTRPETINYRTQKPEKDGLFCEKIFGPSKDWECYCGKYKKIRYKGIVCDKCGVEVTRALVRRERMGHIELASPVSHIWFLRGVPSKIGLILNLPPMALEKVIYFANFIIVSVEEEKKSELLENIRKELKDKKKRIADEFNKKINEAKSASKEEKTLEEILVKLNDERDAQIKGLEEELSVAEKELKEIKPLQIISEYRYQELALKYGPIFEAGIGAEAIHRLLGQVDLKQAIAELEVDILKSQGMKKDKQIKRLKLLRALLVNNIKPDWMVMTVVPVIPPDLRPMVPLDGGRFATSDLNDLYRRVINRNNRLKKLLDLNAPEVIIRNEKRMLQEAADALIDNSARHSKTVVASTGQKRQLKSIADILKGKQGRFRQNLLGKRIDYSGRSVITAGPHLKIYQCGLPKRMALELFKPFIISELIKQGLVHNIRSANRFIESDRGEVWDILENITSHAHVLLNRAPTLHRLGIQAFQPILIEGKAIQLHPLVCPAFNADFDGDQMAVHVPLTEEAKAEAKNIMLASNNLLKPATGDPIISPSKDIVLGCYYITSEDEATSGKKLKLFSSIKEAELAYQSGQISLREKIVVYDKFRGADDNKLETTIGRIRFNKILPQSFDFVNDTLDSKKIKVILRRVIENTEHEEAVKFVDLIKDLGFKALTLSGYSWGMADLPLIEEKGDIIEEADKQVEEIQDQFENGLLTEKERHNKIIETWSVTKDKLTKASKEKLDPKSSVFAMINSGARGSWGQITQMVGMKGLVTNPAGEIIELPIKGSFKEGFRVLEYFISTHGSRKGLSDTALRTASAGYLTRRLVDVVQDVVIKTTDCGVDEGTIVTKKESEAIGDKVSNRIMGRFVNEDIKDGKKIILKKGELVTYEKAKEIEKLDLEQVEIRSAITCTLKKGICQKCYGWDLGHNKLAKMGTAVGIIAAQSIGEPGTQLTMRTFHTGGVAGKDITQGLPRVEELFEARPPKHRAFVADVDGIVSIEETPKTITDPDGRVILSGNFGQKIVKINYNEVETDEYTIGKNDEAKVKDGDKIIKGQILLTDKNGKKTFSKKEGLARLENNQLKVVAEAAKAKEFIIPNEYSLAVKTGDLITRGDRLTDGNLDLHTLFKTKGKEAVQKYMLTEIQHAYSSQGQPLNDKHIEIILRQLFSRVYIRDAGDTDLLPGQIGEKSEAEAVNEKALSEGKRPAIYDELFLGMSKVSLSTTSWLSAASFQETAKVLIDAAVTGKIDHLEGLKENVIIGRLIPAGTGYNSAEEE